jgi:DnaK suppressor protein
MHDAHARHADLKRMLTDRRRKMQEEADGRVRDGRARGTPIAGDDLEQSDASIQRDIDYALLHMHGDAIARVDAALIRLDAGKYGICAECDEDISEARLTALPFAVRCHACAERHEQRQGRERQLGRRGGFTLFPGQLGS